MEGKTNGTGELPEDRAKAVEAGLAMFHKSQAEVEQLKEDLRICREEIAHLNIQLESMKQLNTMLESTVKSHQLERDQAVSERALYEALFIAVQAQMRAFRVPVKPLAETEAPEA